MRRSLATLLAFSLLTASGCSMARSPILGVLYQDVSDVLLVNEGPMPENPKVGISQAMSIIGVTLGDSSLDTARKNGGITKIYYVDYYTWSVLSVYGRTETRVYGE